MREIVQFKCLAGMHAHQLIVVNSPCSRRLFWLSYWLSFPTPSRPTSYQWLSRSHSSATTTSSAWTVCRFHRTISVSAVQVSSNSIGFIPMTWLWSWSTAQTTVSQVRPTITFASQNASQKLQRLLDACHAARSHNAFHQASHPAAPYDHALRVCYVSLFEN